MNSVSVDTDDIMDKLCTNCKYKKTTDAYYHSHGFEPAMEACPAGESGDGEIGFNGEAFYCKSDPEA